MEEKPKSGKEFEELVTWINRCLHEKAVITPNDKILDIHTKRRRQIDISIRLKDGPTTFLGIVEVRDRSRPVGGDFIEQVSRSPSELHFPKCPSCRRTSKNYFN